MRLLTETMPTGIDRWLEMRPSYDHRGENPNYGCHNAELTWGVNRGRFTVTWRLVQTGWFHAALRESLEQSHNSSLFNYLPDGLGSIDYHSPVPQYAGQTTSIHDCKYTGGDCYCDGSSMASSALFDRACLDPAEIWTELEQRLAEVEGAADTYSV